MSVRVPVIGDGVSGKSTVAAVVATQLAKLRKLESKPLVVLTQPTAAYTPWHVDVRRTRTLAGALQAIRQADAPLVLDDLSELYARLVDSWRDQVAEYRERAGLPRKVRLGPDDWQSINAKFRQIFRACASLTVDVVEVYRRGPVMVADGDIGMIEGDGVKARGQAESGSGGDLVLVLDGGLRSRYRDSGNRVLRVLSDVSGHLVREEFALPPLRTAKERERLARDLGAFLRPALVDLIAWSDQEAACWAAVADPLDSWSEAREAAHKSEAALVASQVSALLAIHGLAGQKSDAIQTRAKLLFECFGVGDVDALVDVDPEALRSGFLSFGDAVRRR